jgi:hypothetical protein
MATHKNNPPFQRTKEDLPGILDNTDNNKTLPTQQETEAFKEQFLAQIESHKLENMDPHQLKTLIDTMT